MSGPESKETISNYGSQYSGDALILEDVERDVARDEEIFPILFEAMQLQHPSEIAAYLDTKRLEATDPKLIASLAGATRDFLNSLDADTISTEEVQKLLVSLRSNKNYYINLELNLAFNLIILNNYGVTKETEYLIPDGINLPDEFKSPPLGE